MFTLNENNINANTETVIAEVKGLSRVSVSGDYNDLVNKPEIVPGNLTQDQINDLNKVPIIEQKVEQNTSQFNSIENELNNHIINHPTSGAENVDYIVSENFLTGIDIDGSIDPIILTALNEKANKNDLISLDNEFNALQNEIIKARGTYANLDARLNSTVTGPSTSAAKMCKITNLGDITCNNSSQTALNFTSIINNDDSMFSLTTPTKIICKTAGYYIITAQIIWDYTTGQTTGCRQAIIKLNGNTSIAATSIPATQSTNTNINLTAIVNLAVNDYIELLCYQDSGYPIKIRSVSGCSPMLTALKI